MNIEAQRIAIAEACGTLKCPRTGWPMAPSEIPDYLSDLNAMHEAELSMPFEQYMDFCHTLRYIVESATDSRAFNREMSGTAAHRAEAFLRTLGKWEESK